MEGIIYRIQPYQESARLLFTYTPKGKVTLIARGSQKLKASSRVIAQFLTCLAFKENTSNRTMFSLSDAKLIDDYKAVKDDYDQTQSAALMLEVIDKFVVEDSQHEAIYNALKTALKIPDIQLAALSFILKMLRPLGLELNLKPDGRMVRGVSIEKGGLIYEGEDGCVDLDVKAATPLLKLYYLPYNELGIYEIDTLSEIKSFIQKYYQYHLQTTLKNLK